MRHIILFILGLGGFLHAQEVGLVLNDSRSFQGYTLMSNNELTYLINNDGQVVNSWTSIYKSGHGVYLLPNGNLLRAGAFPGSFIAGGAGGILELFNWEGDLLWSYQIADQNQQQHHDLAPLPSGNFLCTLWERHSESEAQSVGRIYAGEVWSEKIIEIEMLPNNEAEIVWEWSLWDHLIQDQDVNKPNYGVVAEHPELIDLNYIGAGRESSGNWLHVNSIDYNVELDQIAISSRNLNEVYIIDHSTATIEAAGQSGGRYGKGGGILYRYGNPQVYQAGSVSDQVLFGQHDFRWIEDGSSFMLFNNEYLEGSQSKVQQFRNPASNGFYTYSNEMGFGDDSLIRTFSTPDLYSDILSGAAQMPNGNWLILAGRTGRLLEITASDEIVWEYIYPVNRNGGPAIQGAEPRFNLLFRAKRYAPDYSAFINRPLLPREPIELVGNTDTPTISLVNTLATDDLLIDNQLNNIIPAELSLFSINGQLVYRGDLVVGLNRVSLSQLSKGMYLALVQQGERMQLMERWVKL